MTSLSIRSPSSCRLPMSASSCDRTEREAFIRSITETIISDLSSDESPREKSRKNASIRRLNRSQSQKKLRDALGNVLSKKKSTNVVEHEKKEIEKLLAARDHCDNQTNHIRKAYRDGRYKDVLLSCKNLQGYLMGHQVKDDNFYLFICHLYTARAHLAEKSYPKARMFWVKVKKPAQDSGREDLLCESDILEGEILVAEEKFQEASEAWERALKKLKGEEREAWLRHEIGRCYLETGELEESEKHGKVAAEKDVAPWKCFSLLLLGQIAVARSNHQQALDLFKQAEELSITTPDAVSTNAYINAMVTSIKDDLKINE